MNIYIDILFAINLIMNTTIFWIVSKILKLPVVFGRIALGAGAAALLYCILLVFFTAYFNFVTAILILSMGLFIAFGRVGRKKFALLIICSHLVAFFIGGMALALYNYININVFFGVMRNFPFGFLIITIILSYICLTFIHMYIQKLRLTKRAYYTVQIFKGSKSVDIIALVDTGNSLVEPISKWPVIIAEQEHVSEILENIGDKIRLIPYKSIGREGLLTGFRPDKVVIRSDSSSVIEIREVVIGLCDFNLSKKGSYQGLLSPSFLEA